MEIKYQLRAARIKLFLRRGESSIEWSVIATLIFRPGEGGGGDGGGGGGPVIISEAELGSEAGELVSITVGRAGSPGWPAPILG